MPDTPTRAELLVAAALYVGLHMRGLEEYTTTLVMHAHNIEKFPRDTPYIEAIARARALLGSEWRPIDDEAKRAGRILAWCGADGVMTVKWSVWRWVADPNEATEYEPETYRPTRWQPLPDPPPVGEG